MARGLKTDLKGKIFGCLVVIRDSGYRTKYRSIIWKCICLGPSDNRHQNRIYRHVSTSDLNSGRIKSCGCTNKFNGTHGMSYTSEYKSWVAMKRRCLNPNSDTYYGNDDRGKICDRWKNNFKDFLKDMGPKPTKNHSIDRIDNDKGYYPDNCKWSTAQQQNQNQRSTKLNKESVIDIRKSKGVSRKFLARKYDCSERTIRDVLNYRTWRNVL